MTRAGSWMRWGLSLVVVCAVLGLTQEPASAPSHILYVNRTDPTCQGQAPCYQTIQAAINAATSSDRIVIQPGTYPEQLSITGKNNFSGANETHRIVIEADPAAPVGSVVLQGTVAGCTNGHAIRLQQSKFITIRGLTITGAGGQAISLLGGNNQNTAIVIERNRIFGNGSAECNGGITVARGNPGTLIINNLIYANGRNGITFIDADGGPPAVVENTIHANAWSGVNVARNHVVVLLNNLITQNGTASGSTGGRFGVTREASTSPQPVGILLSHNMICGNRLGEINGPALDGTDSGNLTPTGSEGPGVSASPGCNLPSTVYANLNGADGQPGTLDDDFTLAAGSPALDRGFDLRSFLFDPIFAPLLAILQADYTREGARPQPGSPTATAQFDIGAMELSVQDTQPPVVTFLQPAANALVRQTITVEAQATDNTAVTTLALSVGSQTLGATLTPPPPASPVTATATLDTTTLADGAHTLHAVAFDQAGQSTDESRIILVDNTPPETQIDSGPSGEISETSATFTWSGSDGPTSTQPLQFAWRLDGGAFTAFSPDTSATFNGLAEGPHTFEVKARDLTGNEDPTPASRSFTVRFGPSITSVNPSSGPIGTFITITGRNFEAGATQVTFTGAGATSVAAVIRTITATSITTTVPLGAATGPLTVTTSRGSASQTFTVTASGDFTLTAAPGTARVIAGDQTSVNVGAGGSGNFTSLVSLSLTAAPAGITPAFDSPLVVPGSGTFLTLAVGSAVAPGNYPFTVTGRAQVDGQEVTREAAFTLNVLAPDTPAITGRVLTADAVPQPIPGVTVALGGAFTLTDAGGNFVLLAPPPGQNMLLVDGRTASTPTAQYPPVEVNIAVNASGPTRVPFIVYLPRLDTANPINLPLDASGAVTQTVQATTPTIPGLVVTIPQGTRIIGPDGNPVSQITITPVPIDRSPMPFPPGVTFPMLFTIQPGGAVPSTPLPITFPNVQQAPPGETADLYFFDLIAGNWAIWGTGTVSDDGTQIVSDPGVGLPRFAWHSAFTPPRSFENDGSDHNDTDGDPVDVVTGRFTASKVDLALSGRLPVAIQRVYRSENTQIGLFGIGWNLAHYDSTIAAVGTTLTLIAGNRTLTWFAPVAPDVWQNTTEPFLQGARVSRLPGEFNFEIRFKDGTIHRYERIVGFSNAAGLAAMTDRNGNTVTLTRATVNGVFGRITQITEPTGRALTFTYDDVGRVTAITDPIGRAVRYAYDAQGRLDSVVDPAGGETRYSYDANQRILSITDARGVAFLRNEYDAQGRVVRQLQADGRTYTYDYTLLGSLATQTTITDPRGHSMISRFNSQGFTLSRTDPLGQTTIFGYEPTSNQLMVRTDPLGRVTRFGYDAAGNVTTVTDPVGNVEMFTFGSPFNRITSMVDPLGNTTTFEYDPAGNLATFTDPGGATTRIEYNAFGQPTSVADALGHRTTFGYDARGYLTSVTDALGNTRTREYDLVGRMVRQIDPLGNTATFTYDALNRLTSIIDPLGGVTTFTFDPNGNLLNVTDAQGHTTTHTYDVMDRLISRVDPLGAVETFEYDPVGNLIRRTDRKGQVTNFTYDALNRLTTATYADGSVATFTYDAVGRLHHASDTTGGELLYSYDALDRLTGETSRLGTIRYDHDARGRRTRMVPPGQAPVIYAYDANSQLIGVTQGDQQVLIDRDTLGRRVRLTLPNGISTEFQYDAASRLTALVYADGSRQVGELLYQYDAGNKLVAVRGALAWTLLPEPVPSASYDAVNRQLTFGDKVMTYDPAGNLTSLTGATGTTSFSWDARNRLIALSEPGLAASFEYDLLGRRIAKTENADRFEFQYDGGNIQAATHDSRATTYLRGVGIDEMFSLADDSGTSSVITDSLGSVLNTFDETKSVQGSYTYGAFGETQRVGQDQGNPFQFTGREHDATGLYYYRFRYYHPGLKRFISEDPLRPMTGINLNLYSYVFNSPLNAVDPFGLYERDVHFELTKCLATKAGFPPDQAVIIANADQGVDDNPLTSPLLGGRRAQSEYHFVNKRQLHTLWARAVRARQSSLGAGLDSLGQYLHALQDSYAHAGYKPGLGHLEDWKAPDKTYNDPEKANLMARDTYDRLREYHRIASGQMIPDRWDELRGMVDRFNRARSSTDKQKYLEGCR